MAVETKKTDELIDELDSIMEEYKPNVEKINRLFLKATRITSNTKDTSSQYCPSNNSKENLWLNFIQATVDFKKLEEFYNKLSYTKNKKERNIKVYLDKVKILPKKGYTNWEINNIISMKTGLTKRQINRIVKKIDEKIKKN